MFDDDDKLTSCKNRLARRHLRQKFKKVDMNLIKDSDNGNILDKKVRT